MKHKHLTLSDRIEIESGITQGFSFREIAAKIEKDPSTVSKEIRKHLVTKQIDEHKKLPPCERLNKPPYCCNNCPYKRNKCGHCKKFYYAKHAQREYEAELSSAREDIALNKESFYVMNEIVSEGIRKGQHLHHIIITHELTVSRSSLYRYVKKGYLDAAPIDFPRIVKFKQRKSHDLPPIPAKDKVGHHYSDFLEFLHSDDYHYWIEMDTVIGRVGGKVLLTFNVSSCNFLFARLLDNKTASQVVEHLNCIKLDLLKNKLSFSSLFPIILTDNGGEFADISSIESDEENHSHLFFCEANRPDQKARIEKNHTMIRDYFPKGTSFDEYTQEDINLAVSHLNGVKRQSLNNKSAYECFTFMFGEATAKALGIDYIEPNQVIQSPKLFKK
ncbi:IS30 family transposase [Granulicatella sp.]